MRAQPAWPLSTPLNAFLLVWVPFLAIWLWAARYNPWTQVPVYGDTLEVAWGMDWYAQKIRLLENPLFFEGVFHPAGWPTALLAHTPPFLALLGLFRLALPAAAVYNLFMFGSFVVAYAGMRRVTLLYVPRPWIAIVIALLYTYWGMRWGRLGGHLNLLWLSALMPWLYWSLANGHAGRRKVVAPAVLWSLLIIASLYGVWLGALLVALYLLSNPSRETLRQVVLLSLLALLLSLPGLFLFWRGRQAVAAPFYDLAHISTWGASLNSLPLPAIFHPWLGTFVRRVYSGPLDESGVAGMGIVAVLLAGVGLATLRLRHGHHRFALATFVTGLLLALGPVLRWNGQPVQVSWLAPVNEFLWQLGQQIKPAIFPGELAPSLRQSVPLPGWLSYAVIPYFEGSRVAARFAFAGGIGLLVLVALALQRIRARWLATLVVALLLFERAPWPVQSSAALPPPAHPAFAWLAAQEGDGATAVLDLWPAGDGLTLAIAGETLYATALHRRPTAAGVSSMWPEPSWFLFNWLADHEWPLRDPEFGILARGFGVRWILLHEQPGGAADHLDGASEAGLRLVTCFDPPPEKSPWPHVICVLEVPEARDFNIQARKGWSEAEPWGRWAEGPDSSARWVVPLMQPYVLEVDAFPHCVAGQVQRMQILVNEHPLGEVVFDDCAPFSGVLEVPLDTLRLGWNRIQYRYAYAISPAEATQGENPDERPLSVGFTHLRVKPLVE